MRSRAEALASVRERLDRTAADQDPRWILGDQALADAGELAAVSGPGGDLDAAYLLGMFYWFRFEASGPQAGHDDVAVAALFLIPVFTSDPGTVPESLRRLYQQPGGPGGNTDPAAAAGRARAQYSAYQDSGQLPSLWDAITLFRAAITATPAGHLDLAGYLSGLGGALLKLAERTGDAGLLEQAVRTHRAAAAAAPAGHPDRGAVLANLGAALEKLGQRTADTAPLEEAVQTCREAAAMALISGPVHALCLNNLGNALLALAEQTGNRSLLEQAVTAHRAAVADTASDDPYRPGRLANLGTALEAWYERTGNAGALREAADSIRGAVAATPAGRPARTGYLSNLGAALQRLFERTMETAVLTEAVAAHRAAVAATSGDHADRARRLSNLGNAMLALAERTGDAQTLQDAVDMCQAAADAAPAGHPEHAANLSKLNGALLVQARRVRDGSTRTSLLEQAVQAGQDAVQAAPAGQPDRAMYLDNLGAALQALAEHTGRTALLDQAGHCFARAAADVDAPAAVRISGYQSMLRLPGQAGLSPRQALEAAETAAMLLPQGAPRNLTRADRQYSLGRLASIAGLAAAAAVTAGQPGRAVELLEQTRGILAADTLDARGSDLTRLRAQAPEAAQAFDDLRARIDDLTSPPLVLAPEPAGHEPDPAQARRDAASDWDNLLARIRATGGFEDFLRAPGPRPAGRPGKGRAGHLPVCHPVPLRRRDPHRRTCWAGPRGAAARPHRERRHQPG
jgi:hypothetical protein